MQVIEIESFPAILSPPKKQSQKHVQKQVKPERACDFCRKRKTKCDGPWSKDHICSNCRSSKIDCTYVESSKPRGPPKAYITSLEDKVEMAEQFIKRLRPDLDLNTVLGLPVERDSWKKDGSDQPSFSKVSQRASGSPEINVALRMGLQSTSNRPSKSPPQDHGRDDGVDAYPDDDSDVESSTKITRHARYEGKSSDAGLVQATLQVKQEYDHDYHPTLTQEPDMPEWEYRAWGELEPRRPFKFPPPDLCEHLIDLYFEHSNNYFPLLHRPTFDAQYRSSLHTRDRAFAAMFFSLLALGSRFSTDSRVYDTPSSPALSCGWKFFFEAVKYRPTAMAPACLFDLQRFAILSSFLRWTRHAPAAWNMIALAIRLAQDMGVHRKKRYQHHPTVEDELWKRAFWLLVTYDRVGSATLGRPCCSREEDFDVELPLEVDDEYWIDEDPDLAFKQPPGKPSRISGINSFIKITQMMAFAMRTIYCIDKTKVLLGLVGPSWREQVIQQLNEAMDEWTQTLPEHLKWNPNIEDPVFSNQSSTVYTSYYLLLLLIYRPFIPPPNTPRVDGKPAISEEYPFPAMAICTSAARAGVRILETQLLRGLSNIPNLIAVAHLCGATLLMNVWEVKKHNEKADTGDLVRDVKICLKALETCADRWEAAAEFLRGLRAGLPKDQPAQTTHPHVDKASAPPPTQSRPPSKPPMPPGATDYPHERAMQPPKLTDGWHWFSQVGIGPNYVNNSDGGNLKQTGATTAPVTAATEVINGSHRGRKLEHRRLSSTPSQPPSQSQTPSPPVLMTQLERTGAGGGYPQSYPRSASLPRQSPRHPIPQPETHAPSPTTPLHPYAGVAPSPTHVSPSEAQLRMQLSSSSGQLPWWVERAVEGRAAYINSGRGRLPNLVQQVVARTPASSQPYYSTNVNPTAHIYPQHYQPQHSTNYQLSTSSGDHNMHIHAGGSVQDWQQLAEPHPVLSMPPPPSTPTSANTPIFVQPFSPATPSNMHATFLPDDSAAARCSIPAGYNYSRRYSQSSDFAGR